VIQFELETDRTLFENSFRFAQQQVRALLERDPDFYPIYTEKGKWRHEKPVWTHWCDGFLPGIMWIFHRHLGPGTPEGERWFKDAARYSKPLEPRKFDTDVHDHGFIFMSSYYRWYRLTKDPALKEVLVQAGQTLAERFNNRGNFLRSFVAEDSLFIDIMMDVGIIYFAALETGDRMMREIATRHALTTRRTLVRGDGSTAHEGLFDLETGEFLRQSTHQGFRADSCWSRGLVWALYGFNTCYEYSRDPRFLETSQACADYYITHCPSDGIPPWDFQAPPESRKLQDTSAAAIAAAGLLRLCRLVQDPMKGHLYWTTAIRILRSLCEKHVAINTPGWEGILKGGVYHVHKELGVNESVMWGEYFFVEALDSALRQMQQTDARI
jgi:unsaturated chondroitin disaccharide hydrolase